MNKSRINKEGGQYSFKHLFFCEEAAKCVKIFKLFKFRKTYRNDHLLVDWKSKDLIKSLNKTRLEISKGFRSRGLKQSFPKRHCTFTCTYNLSSQMLKIQSEFSYWKPDVPRQVQEEIVSESLTPSESNESNEPRNHDQQLDDPIEFQEPQVQIREPVTMDEMRFFMISNVKKEIEKLDKIIQQKKDKQ